jgi:hypothetical protein
LDLKIPSRSFFKFASRCPFRAEPPVIDGVITEWSEEYRVPDLGGIEGGQSFAEFYMAWNDDGLYFALELRGDASLDAQMKRPLRGDGLQIWVDTRDVRDAHRASRFCHHFYFLPGKGRRKPIGGQVRLRRARAHSRLCETQDLSVATRGRKKAFSMEIHIPAHALTGFDPGENNRLGFTYLLRDRKLGRQYWTADDPLPVSYDPSLWGTVILSK